MNSLTVDTPASGVSRGRPRDSNADENILAAARDLLARSGFDAMSFEAVAQQAGVSRPTVYRRWPTKVHLAHEIAHGTGQTIPDIIVSQGLREQLRAFLTMLMDQYRQPERRAAAAGLIVSYQAAPDLRHELHTPLEMQTRQDLAAIIAKGKATGLVRQSADADALFDLAVGAIVFRTMFSSLPLAETTMDEVCETLLAGVEAHRHTP